MQLPRHPKFTSQLSYEISARDDHSTLERILAWSCLLVDSIIFQLERPAPKNHKITKSSTNFIDLQTEKSFNRERTRKPGKAN